MPHYLWSDFRSIEIRAGWRFRIWSHGHWISIGQWIIKKRLKDLPTQKTIDNRPPHLLNWTKYYGAFRFGRFNAGIEQRKWLRNGWKSHQTPNTMQPFILIHVMFYKRSIAVTEFDCSVYLENLKRCLVYLDDVHTRSTDLKFPSTMKFKLVCTREWCILRVRLNKFMGLIPRPRAQDLEQAFRNGVIEEKVLPMEKRQYSEAISNCLSQCKFQDNPVDLAKIGWYSSSNTAQRVTCGFDLDRNKKMLIDFFYGFFRE